MQDWEFRLGFNTMVQFVSWSSWCKTRVEEISKNYIELTTSLFYQGTLTKPKKVLSIYFHFTFLFEFQINFVEEQN